MKKFLILLFLIAFAATPAGAYCDYQNLCPSYAENFGTKTSDFLSNLSGANFLLENVAQSFIAAELKKATNQNFDVKVNLLGMKELSEGKFKSITISSNNVSLGGIKLSSFKAQTLCKFNWIDFKAKPVVPKENLVVGIWAEFSADDLRQSLMYKDYSKELSKINLSEIGISSFSVYPDTISIEDNKLYFTMNAIPNGWYRSVDINVCADVKAQKGQIEYSKINYMNIYSAFDIKQTFGLFNQIKDLNFAINLYGKLEPKSRIQIVNLDIVNNKIRVYAIAFIPKRSV